MKRLFGGCFDGRRVLVTGHTGFKGSWLALWLQQMGARVCGLALPPERPLSHAPLLELRLDDAIVDLREAAAVRYAVRRLQPELVFHLAAQPLVRRSYKEPRATFDTNVMGLVNLFEAVRATPSVRAIVNVTSDKCYANANGPRALREGDPMGGHDPYSTSKACAELVSASYRVSFLAQDDSRGHPVALATARAGNVIGGGDWGDDRLVPDLVRSAVAGLTLAVRHPHATRPWQHVLEPLAGYLMLGQRLLEDPTACADAWNFGPDADGHLSVGEMVSRMAALWPAVRYEVDAAAQPYEAPVLHLDASKALERLGWRPVWNTTTTLARTIEWYRAWHERRAVVTRDDLRAYVDDARTAGLPWAGA